MKIVVLAGGISTERDVSLSSGAKITNALRENGHEVAYVDSFLGVKDKHNIFKTKEDNVIESYIIPDNPPSVEELKRQKKTKGLFGENVLEICQEADIVFIALHGEFGEDGRVQATLESLGIRYTGSGYRGSAIAMDKDFTKRIINDGGVLTAKWVRVTDDMKSQDIIEKLDFPMVVKPSNGGSSVGVSIVNSEEELSQALSLAREYDKKILVEEYVKGREFSVGILEGKALPPIEIIPKEGFYDYKNKYQAELTEEICPAELSEEETKVLQEAALKSHQLLMLRGYSRVDFIRKAEGKFVFLEVNTLPGMTPTSLLPQEAKAVGIEYNDLCNRIVKLEMN